MTSSLDVRNITLQVLSASDLRKATKYGKQEVYAVAYVYRHDKKSTKVDKDGGLNPAWNSNLKFLVEDNIISQGSAAVTVEVRCRGMFGSKLLGSARIPISVSPKENNSAQFMTFELWKPSKKSQGVGRGSVNVSVTVGEKRSVQLYHPPAAQNRGYHQRQGYGYPQQSYGYPQQSYGYPQQSYGYGGQSSGYPQQGYYQQPRRRGGGGLGILAALLGGLLLGDVLF